MKCGACGKNGLRSTTLAWVPAANGDGLERRRVCGDCVGGALVVVLRKAMPECLHCHEPAIVCSEHGASGTALREAADAFKRVAKKLRGMATAYEANPRMGSTDRAMGLQQAADILDAGDY